MVPLNFHHLYYFYVIATEGSIAKACKTLLLSQPAVSSQLGLLERSLGLTLFERRNQRLHLTEEGRFVLEYATTIFETAAELQKNMKRRAPSAQPEVRVGILSGTARAFGHALAECILTRRPEARVTVREGSLKGLLGELGEQAVDMILSTVSINGSGRGKFHNHLVGRVPIVLAASPSLARRHPRFPRDLDGAPFILPAPPSPVYRQILDRLAEWKVEPKSVVEVQDAELARSLALSGRGITPLNAFTLSKGLGPGKLAIVGSERKLGLFEPVYIISAERRWPNPLVRHVSREFRLPVNGA